MQEHIDYYTRPKTKAEAIDRQEQQGWILWALMLSFSLAAGLMFFSLTI